MVRLAETNVAFALPKRRDEIFGGAAGRCRRHFFPLAFASFAFLILAAIHAGICTAFADE